MAAQRQPASAAPATRVPRSSIAASPIRSADALQHPPDPDPAAAGRRCRLHRIQNNQGYIADEELVASVQPGVDNKQSVERALGRPTMSGQFDDNVWYYVSRNTQPAGLRAARSEGPARSDRPLRP
jgi:hypothetical protein